MLHDTHPEHVGRRGLIYSAQLRRIAESAKKLLSTADEVTVSVTTRMPHGSGSVSGVDVTIASASAERMPDSAEEEHTITVGVSRRDFESACASVFDRAMRPLTRLLDELDMSPDDIDEIVLVGGTTRVPKVKHLLRDFFGKVSLPRVIPLPSYRTLAFTPFSRLLMHDLLPE